MKKILLTLSLLCFLVAIAMAQTPLPPEVWIRPGSNMSILMSVQDTAQFVNPSGVPLSLFDNDAGYLEAETDPTIANHIKNITPANIADWNDDKKLTNAQVVSIVENAGFLDAETDPNVPNHVKGITQADINNWNNDEGLSNAEVISIVENAGYLDEEVDPTIAAHVKAITQADINNWNSDVNYLQNYEVFNITGQGNSVTAAVNLPTDRKKMRVLRGGMEVTNYTLTGNKVTFPTKFYPPETIEIFY